MNDITTTASANEFIPLSVPEIKGNEWQYIKECLDTNWVSSVGPFVDSFEQQFADYIDDRFAVATVNGTAALHLALLTAGVQPDDEVLVSTLTFIAPANAIRYVGARPIFIDAEQKYWQMDPEKVIHFLEHECKWRNSELRNKSTGRRIAAIIPVHILGHPVDMDPIINIARKYNLVVIEDASESLGAKYKGRPVGSSADISCFSFNGNKIITTGGGGMIVFAEEDLANRAKYLSTQAKDDPVEYIHNEIGYNYRLTNIQAAMGCAQMAQLNDYIAAKQRIACAYTEALSKLDGISCMSQASWATSTYWMYTVLIDELYYGQSSKSLLKKLSALRIQARPLWQPLHLSKAHNSPQSHCDIAKHIYEKSLSLPCSVGLQTHQQAFVIEMISSIYK